MDYLEILKNLDAGKAEASNMSPAVAGPSYEKNELNEKSPLQLAPCATSCYEVEPGRWMHHPWDGCTTIPKPKAANISTADCAHCGGTGECPCPACNLRRTGKPVPCLMCQPEKRQVWLAATRPEREAPARSQ